MSTFLNLLRNASARWSAILAPVPTGRATDTATMRTILRSADSTWGTAVRRRTPGGTIIARSADAEIQIIMRKTKVTVKKRKRRMREERKYRETVRIQMGLCT